MGRLFQKRNKNETLPQQANDVEAPCSCGSNTEVDEGKDLGLVLLTEHDQPFHKDEGSLPHKFLGPARQISIHLLL